ncbi:ribonuclease H-like domain-containing protein [Tanacetum coccineum]|uniref:Ribonuclease H-like domain-containing protein n=1 Tax=Tanacetum coccineum TaxID=301880 RepID=A0ABQ5J6X1_9ASTR
MPGRPRKERIKASSENNSQVSRVGRVMRCSNCQGIRHNKASCNKEPVPKAPIQRRSPGRTRQSVFGTHASARGRGRGSRGGRGAKGGRNGTASRGQHLMDEDEIEENLEHDYMQDLLDAEKDNVWESYSKLKKLYDEQREQLGDASIEIQVYTQALKKVEAQLVYAPGNTATMILGTNLDWSSDIEDSLVHERFANVEGMHAFPPLMTGNYMPSGPDREVNDSMFTYGPNKTLKSVPEPVVVEPKVVSQPKVWSDAPIIEEYESDSNDESVIQPSKEQEKPSFAFVNTVKHVKMPRETVIEQNTYSLSPKANKRDWNGLMSKRRPFNRTTAPRTKFSNQKVNTAEVKAVSVVRGKREIAIKPSACYNPQRALKKKGIVDSGCSRHMTGNKAYLAEYQDYNGGPVAFGGSKGYITGKAPEGEGSEQPIEPQPTPSPTQPILGDQPLVTATSSSHDTTQDSRDSLEGTNRSEGDQVQPSHDSPLLDGPTSDRVEGGITLEELYVLCTNLSNRVLALEASKDAQAAEIIKIKTRIKKLKKKSHLVISYHRAWLRSVSRLSMKRKLGRKESVSKQGRKNAKPRPTLDAFNDLDVDLAHGMAYMDTEEAVNKKGGSTVSTVRTEKVSTASVTINTADLKISIVEPRTPPTTASIFNNEDVTMAQTLIKMKEKKAKEKGLMEVQDISRLSLKWFQEDGTEFYMLAERRYPLTKETLERMLALRLIAESKSEAVFDLLRFIQQKLMNLEAMMEVRRIFKCWFYNHTTNGHEFTMSNRHQELASPEQTASGKDFSNPLMADSLPKTIWIDDLFNQLQVSRYFSKIDICSGYHQLRVHGEDIPKTVFRTIYVHFKFTIMPFGLTNAPAVFMELMNRVCKPYLDKFFIVFIDDILIYSKYKEDHEVHLKLVLELLKKEKLFASFSKYQFWLQEVRFLRHGVNNNDIYVDSSKTEAMKN